MEVWYRISTFCTPSIEQRDVVRVTDKTVFFKNGASTWKERKESEFHTWVPTKDAAIRFVRKLLNQRIMDARSTTNERVSELNDFESKVAIGKAIKLREEE